MLFVLAAFVLQGFALQVHLHGLTPPLWTSADGLYAVHSGALGGGSAPDEASCPICQAAHSVGSYLLPAAFALPLLVLVWGSILPQAQRFGAKPRSHQWQGRAPPFV